MSAEEVTVSPSIPHHSAKLKKLLKRSCGATMTWIIENRFIDTYVFVTDGHINQSDKLEANNSQADRIVSIFQGQEDTS